MIDSLNFTTYLTLAEFSVFQSSCYFAVDQYDLDCRGFVKLLQWPIDCPPMALLFSLLRRPNAIGRVLLFVDLVPPTTSRRGSLAC